MAFVIKPGKPIRGELKRVLRHQLQRARRRLQQDGGTHVHEARKGVKKARAIVELLRQAQARGLRKDARRLRAAGRILSTLRDADVMLETFTRLSRAVAKRVPEHTLAAIRRGVTQAKTQAVANAEDERGLAQAADRLRTVRRSAADWNLPTIEPADLPDVVKDAYRTARKAMHRAQRTSRTSDLHEWRKRVKTLWYELRLLEACAPSLHATIEDLDQLETLLGEHHDLFMLKTAIAKAGPPGAADARRAVSDVAKARQDTVRRKAFMRGRQLLAEKPKAFARALRKALSAAAPRAESGPDQSASSAA